MSRGTTRLCHTPTRKHTHVHKEDGGKGKQERRQRKRSPNKSGQQSRHAHTLAGTAKPPTEDTINNRYDESGLFDRWPSTQQSLICDGGPILLFSRHRVLKVFQSFSRPLYTIRQCCSPQWPNRMHFQPPHRTRTIFVMLLCAAQSPVHGGSPGGFPPLPGCATGLLRPSCGQSSVHDAVGKAGFLPPDECSREPNLMFTDGSLDAFEVGHLEHRSVRESLVAI